MGRTIAVVEDEALIAASVAARLRAEGFIVETASDGRQGVDLCRRLKPDLVVLDLMLPGIDGLEVCRRIQADRPLPVLMLTARDSETDVLVGLGVGADDYMTKPFSPRELVARVHALLRRAERGSVSGAAAGEPERPVVVGALEIDAAGRRVRIHGEEIHLTPTEFALLEHLALRPGMVFSREQLLSDVWQYADASGVRTVDSHIAALRRKLGPGVLRTARGVGYGLEETPGA
jgi:DNA-binding response OmpR family regulator